jgi:hypothetical protein
VYAPVLNEHFKRAGARADAEEVLASVNRTVSVMEKGGGENEDVIRACLCEDETVHTKLRQTGVDPGRT